MTSNLNKKPKGKRYDVFTKTLYEVVKILGGGGEGGWRMVKFLSLNLEGPSEKTVKSIVRNVNQPAEQGFQGRSV